MSREIRTILLAEDSAADAEMAIDALREAKLANPIVHVEDGVETLEARVGAVAARVHDPLRDPLVVEVEDLVAQREVLEQGRPAVADLERVLSVSERSAGRGRHALAALDPLVELVTLAALVRGG